MRTWHTTEGLPSDSVTAVVQTRDGFLWIGTSAGLVRFDGVKFTEEPPVVSPLNNLTGVSALCEDNTGALWIGTQENGLFRLAGGELVHYAKQQGGLLSENVTCLAVDSHGQVWVGSHAGMSVWSGHGFYSFTKRDGLPDASVSGINVARSGIVWVTTKVGMCQYVEGRIVPFAFQTESQGRSPEYLGAYEDQRGNLWAFGDTYLINLTEGKRFNYFRSSEPGSVRIWSLCEGHDGRLWFGTSGRGLYCFENNRFQPVILDEDRWPYDVHAICEDREGNVWLGTAGGGLVQLKVQSVFALRESLGLPNSLPTALARDAGGRIYVGLQRGGLWAGGAGKFEALGGGGFALDGYASSVCVARDGTIWAGTLGNGVYGLREGRNIHFTGADGLRDDTVLAMGLDEGVALWLSTKSGGVDRLADSHFEHFDLSQSKASELVTAMIPAASGGLWLGTKGGEIWREAGGKFKMVRRRESHLSRPILALFESDQGRLWIGSQGAGLGCLADGASLTWNTNNGLPDATITGVAEDAAKNLWLGTSRGIFRVGRAEVQSALNNPQYLLSCRLVSAAKTMNDPNLAIGGLRVVLTSDGYIWFVTAEGVLNLDTKRSESEPAPFPVYVESVAINGQPPMRMLRGGLWSHPVQPAPLVAPGDLRSLDLRFTALSFVSPQEIRFRHRLEGSDADWVDDVGARQVHYGHLPRGTYRFRVAARLADGPWFEAADVFAFTVPTPLYFQTWVIILYGVASVSLVVGTVRLIFHRRLRRRLARLEQERTLERERMRIARDMHDEMGSKLTKISFLSEHVQMDALPPGPALEKVQSIAQTSRDLLQTMDEIVWVVNPRNDTLENLLAYFSHYASEYFQNTSIECELRLPAEIPPCPLSSEARHNLFLTFEEVLNNVLKHSGATCVKVTMSVTRHEFEIMVADNGRGFDAAGMLAANGETGTGRRGNGLRNMRQRLAVLEGLLTVNSQGGGTTVTMRIHISHHSHH